MLNKGVTPVVCQKGSVGASGDLAPMAQAALLLMGEGEAFYQGVRLSGAEAMRAALSKHDHSGASFANFAAQAKELTGNKD